MNLRRRPDHSESASERGERVPAPQAILEGVLRWSPPIAGPLLIVATVVLVLHRLAFAGVLPIESTDPLPLWLPTWCFLGKSLSSGHIPAWNPYVMGGLPFAADPQSGWMYFPAMLLFTLLPCQFALRWFIVLQPVLAGLGVYWFLRCERMSRPGATAGGLVLALGIAGSGLALRLPLSATLAWTSLLLAAASRMLRADTWPRRITWILLAAVAWGQLAAAFATDGLAIGTLALVLFLALRTVRDVDARASIRRDLASFGLLVPALLLVNLAYFLPRIAYLPRVSLSLGYRRLNELSAQLLGGAPISFKAFGRTGGVSPVLPLRLSAAPGIYLGALGLSLAFVGWRARRLRSLAVVFSLYGMLSYILAIHPFVERVAPLIGSSRIGSFYLHDPFRYFAGVILAIAVLAGIGVDGWLEPRGRVPRAVFLLPGIAVWIGLPLLLGLHRTQILIPVTGLILGSLALAGSAVRPALAAAIPLVIAGELTFSGLGGQQQHLLGTVNRPQVAHLTALLPTGRTTILLGEYVRAGPIASYLEDHRGDGRYLIVDPADWNPRGYHIHLTAAYWGLMATQRSIFFGLEEAQGYNSEQLRRYWTFDRASEPKRMLWNAAGFTEAMPVVTDLLNVGFVIQPATDPPAISGSARVASEGTWVLYTVRPPPPRATFVPSWSVVGSESLALDRTLALTFDPGREVILERDPGFSAGSGNATSVPASFRWEGNQAATVTVDAPGAGIVVIRNAFERDWHATVDGHSVPLLAADYLDQGVAVPPGRHTIRLSYDDGTIGFGLAGSALSILALIGLARFLAARDRQRRREEALTER
jgi:hypothetical protein